MLHSCANGMCVKKVKASKGPKLCMKYKKHLKNTPTMTSRLLVNMPTAIETSETGTKQLTTAKAQMHSTL